MRKLREPRRLKTGWQARVTIGDSDRSIGVYPTKNAALMAQAAWASEHGDTTADPFVTFDEYAKLVLNSRVGEVTPETLTNDRGRVKKWISPTFGTMRVAEITHTKVKTWFYALPDMPSRRMIYNTLSLILDHAHQDGILRIKPRVRGATKILSTEKRLYTSDEIWSVLDRIPEWARIAFIVQWGGGLRISEALGLDWDAVDLKTGRVEIRQQSYKGHVKPELKTVKSRRTIYLTEDAVEALRAHRRANPGIGSTPLFLNPGTGERLLARRAYELWKRARGEAGIPDIVPQAMRRNDLSNYRVATGYDAIKTMARGGHGDYRSYLTYQRDVDNDDAEAIKALSAAKKRKAQ